MGLSLRPAQPDERDAAEALSRLSMGRYREARGMAWEPERFRASWDTFENLAIIHGERRCGFLRLLPEGDALAIRDLQIAPECQGRGVGTWAIEQAKQLAADRGYGALRLRVYPENPAMALYARRGFEVERIEDAVVHMRWNRGTRETSPCPNH